MIPSRSLSERKHFPLLLLYRLNLVFLCVPCALLVTSLEPSVPPSIHITYIGHKPLRVQCHTNISQRIPPVCALQVYPLPASPHQYPTHSSTEVTPFCEYAFKQTENTFVIAHPQPSWVYLVPCMPHRAVTFGSPPRLSLRIVANRATVPVGDVLHIMCLVSPSAAAPTGLVYWYKNGEELLVDGRRVFAPQSHVVVILPVQEADRGSYACRVRHAWGDSNSQLVTIAVDSDTSSGTSLQKMQTQTVPLGQSLHLPGCMTRWALPTVWFRLDGHPMPEFASNDKPLVASMDMGDSTVFVCSTEAGVNFTNFNSSNSEWVRVIVETSPVILTTAVTQFVIEGAEVFFHCQHAGVPRAIVEWEIPRKTGGLTTAGSSPATTGMQQEVFPEDGRLRVSDVTIDQHDGAFTCTVHSHLGSTHLTSQLSVESRRLSCPPILHDLPPKVLEVFVGQKAILRCSPAVEDLSVVLGRMLPSGEQFLGDEQQLTLSSVNLSDSGNYFCRLLDAGGGGGTMRNTTYEFQLTVAPFPQPSVHEVDDTVTPNIQYLRPPSTSITVRDISARYISLHWKEVTPRQNAYVFYSIEWCQVHLNEEVSGWRVWHPAWPKNFVTVDQLTPDQEVRFLIRSRYIARYATVPSSGGSLQEWSYPSRPTAWLKTLPDVLQANRQPPKTSESIPLRMLILSVTQNRMSQTVEIRWRLEHSSALGGATPNLQYVLTPISPRHCLTFMRQQVSCTSDAVTSSLDLENWLFAKDEESVHSSTGVFQPSLSGDIPQHDPTWLVSRASPNTCYNISVSTAQFNVHAAQDASKRYVLQLDQYERFFFTHGLAQHGPPQAIHLQVSAGSPSRLRLTWQPNEQLPRSEIHGFAVEVYLWNSKDRGSTSRLLVQKYLAISFSNLTLQWEWQLPASLLWISTSENEGVFYVRLATRDCQGFFSPWSSWAVASVQNGNLSWSSLTTTTLEHNNSTSTDVTPSPQHLILLVLLAVLLGLVLTLATVYVCIRYRGHQKLLRGTAQCTLLYEVSSTNSTHSVSAPSRLLSNPPGDSPSSPGNNNTTTEYANATLLYDQTYAPTQMPLSASPHPRDHLMRSSYHDYPLPYAVTPLTRDPTVLPEVPPGLWSATHPSEPTRAKTHHGTLPTSASEQNTPPSWSRTEVPPAGNHLRI